MGEQACKRVLNEIKANILKNEYFLVSLADHSKPKKQSKYNEVGARSQEVMTREQYDERLIQKIDISCLAARVGD